jgi:hypothetical protein
MPQRIEQPCLSVSARWANRWVVTGETCPEELPDLGEGDAVLEEPGGVVVTQVVRPGGADAGRLDDALPGPIDRR